MAQKKYHATSRHKKKTRRATSCHKKSCNLSAQKKITQSLGKTTNRATSLHKKNHAISGHNNKSRNLFAHNKFMQPLRTKK